MPHVPTRPARIAEGGGAAPAQGQDALEGEVADGEVGEKRYVSALERVAEGEESVKRTMVRGGEVEVCQAGEGRERNKPTRSGCRTRLQHGDCEVLKLWGGVVEGLQLLG